MKVHLNVYVFSSVCVTVLESDYMLIQTQSRKPKIIWIFKRYWSAGSAATRRKIEEV